MKITVLSPHRDDAAFSIGLAIETWLNVGHSVDVINCFTETQYAPFSAQNSYRPNDRPLLVTALRHREDIRWTNFYRHPVYVIDLGLTDAPERLHCGIDEVCMRAANLDLTTTKIREALERRATDSVVLPLGIGHHVDHLTARLAAQDGWPSSFPMAFYEDLPYAARPGAAAAIEPSVRNVGSDLCASFARGKTDVKVAEETKRCMALCYDSQIDHETAEQIAGFCKRYEGRERLWVNCAWLDAGMGILD